ncbi:MAG TPA: hypothetical protein VK465_09475, partial [Fibrobacteria bacterium]|nr:hypothetical protein [Fibrobacteria bacterium]
ARATMHQKVEGQDLKNLRAGHASVQEVNDLLPLGRANVNQDIAKAKDANIPVRKVASYKLLKSLLSGKNSRGEVSETDIFRAGAASFLYAKTGSCGSYAAITTPLHAAKLADMQEERAIVSQAAHGTIDHAWSEMMPKGMGEDGKPILHGKDVIMDGWCKENLAVLREDSEYARLDKDGNANQIKHQDHLDHTTGPAAWKSVENYKARIEGSSGKQGLFQRVFDRLVARGFETPKKNLWDAETVFHADFLDQAGKALHPKTPSRGEGAGAQGAKPDAEHARHGLLAEIQAVGVARSLGANIRGAKAEAPGIIASAKDMFPDPR